MLLRSRGKSRGRGKSGLLSNLTGGLLRLLGGSGRRQSRSSQGRSSGSLVPGWLAFAVALACFGGGYVVRGYVAPDQVESGGGAGLKAGPRAPSMIEVDTAPLAGQAFFMAAYTELPPAEAKDRAVELSRFLQGLGVAKARPYEYPAPAGRLWVVVVYYDGEAEYEATRTQLLELPTEAPDPVFVGYRTKSGFPEAFPIQ